MKQRFATLVASVALACVVGPAVAHAQDALVADVPFKFIAGGKAHDAGRYGLRVADDLASLELIPPKGSADVMLVMTRLAAPDNPALDGRLVFDQVGDTYTLSEVWLHGEEGFLMHVTKEKHTHHVTPLRGKAK